jgi:hypothetical protein
LNWENINCLNRSITNYKIVAVKKSLPTKKKAQDWMGPQVNSTQAQNRFCLEGKGKGGEGGDRGRRE